MQCSNWVQYAAFSRSCCRAATMLSSAMSALLTTTADFAAAGSARSSLATIAERARERPYRASCSDGSRAIARSKSALASSSRPSASFASPRPKSANG
jgi:hypothetical protein